MRTTITNTTLASQLGQLAVARQIKKTQDELQWIVAQKLRKRKGNNKNNKQTPTSELGLRRKQQPKTNSHIRAGTAGWDKNRTTKSPTHTTKTKEKQNINKHENNNNKHNSSLSAGTTSGCKTNQENTG